MIKYLRFPEEENPETLIDIEDLTDVDFLVACVEDYKENKFVMYIWKGSSVTIDLNNENDYITKVKHHFFNHNYLNEVTTIEESPYNESDDFINLL